MKMHSYMSVNGHLQEVTFQSQTLADEIRQATLSVGGWEKAVLEARSRTESDTASVRSTTSSDDTQETTPSGTPSISAEGTTSSYTDAATAVALRRRLAAVSTDPAAELVVAGSSSIRDAEDSNGGVIHAASSRAPHALVDHPDPRISDLAKEYTELQSELTSPGLASGSIASPNKSSRVTWPANITVKDFAMYQLIPSLVYELEYPRTDKIRPIYVFEKTVRSDFFIVICITPDLTNARRQQPSEHLPYSTRSQKPLFCHISPRISSRYYDRC